MSSLWQPDVDIDTDTETRNPFSFGGNGRHSGQYIASKLGSRSNLLVEKRDMGDYYTVTDCEGNQIGFPGRGLEPCEYRHIKSTVRRLWGIVLCLAAMAGFTSMILSAI